MTIDWEKEVKNREEAILTDLFELLAIPSVREDSQANDDAPVGPGPKAALLKFLEFGERDGFITKNVGNIAGHIEYGEGSEILGIFGHVDVVPAGTGWDTDPFTPIVKDGKLIARGASDDKGPSMAAYYALKIIQELKLPISKKIRFIIGTDEESGWKCMDRYLAVEETPDFGFSPDAEFPIINGEKGIVSIRLHFGGKQSGTFVLEQFTSGIRENMVPESAQAVVKVKDASKIDSIKEQFAQFLEKESVSGQLEITGDSLSFQVYGKSAHGAFPQTGINGGTFLASFLAMLPFEEDSQLFLKTAGVDLHQDPFGKKIGIDHTDEKMGELTINPGIFSFEHAQIDSSTNYIVLNIRYPQGTTLENIQQELAKKLGEEVTISLGRAQEPHYVPADDPLVTTLLDVYEEHTGT